MISQLKKIGLFRFAYERAAKRLCGSSLANNEILKGFVDDNGWLFTQPKTGTNLIASTLAFYNAETLGVKNSSFDDVYKLGVIHGGYIIRDAAGISQALSFQRLSSQMPIIRWHDEIPDARPELVICTTRPVLDQLASFWNYKYRPQLINVDKAIPEMMARFINRNHAQTAAIGRAGRAVIINYDDLIMDPKSCISSIITSAYGDLDERSLDMALQKSSKTEFRKWEARRGKSAISTELAKYEASFIRSGRIGEGKDFFSNEQKRVIAKLAERDGLDLSGKIFLPETAKGLS